MKYYDGTILLKMVVSSLCEIRTIKSPQRNNAITQNALTLNALTQNALTLNALTLNALTHVRTKLFLLQSPFPLPHAPGIGHHNFNHFPYFTCL